MKHTKWLIAVVVLLQTALFTMAQPPEKLSYQAVIRNGSNQLMANQIVGIRISILQGTADGTEVYTETQTPTTNANGLVSIEIGSGSGFNTINWANGTYFIKTETDPAGGTNYTITGTSQILSVPYALHSKTAEVLTGEAAWQSNNQNIYYNKGNVGIGVENPSVSLHVSGNGLFEGNGSIILGNNSIFFADSGRISSYDEADYHSILFRRNEDILEFREYGDIVFSSGALEAKQTNKMVLKADGNLELNNKNVRNLADPVNASDAATKAYVDGKEPVLTIGQSYQGGIIFWLDATGQHGLIAATTDQSTEIEWYNGTYRWTGTTGDGLYAGEMNTAMIVATQMADNQTGNFAAKVCADYSVTVNGVTYGDWYLPSKYELNLLYQQKEAVGGFASAYYWSSSDYGNNYAWRQIFDVGFQTYNLKKCTDRVRAVRAF